MIRLRAFCASDAPSLVDLWRDPAIRLRNEVPDPELDAAGEWIAKTATKANTGVAWEWAIVDAATGHLAGRRALKGIDRDQGVATAASWVGPTFRGRRFAPRSLRLAAAHAFSEGGLSRIIAECETDNLPALHAMTAAGMHMETTLRGERRSLTGDLVDVHLLAIQPRDLQTPLHFVK